MIRKLRWKFVIVTMCLITVTFGTIMIADYAFTKYWEKETITSTLLGFAQSDVESSEELKEVVSMNLFYDEVFLVSFDENKKITKKQSPKNGRLRISNETLEKLAAKGDSEYKYDTYMYAIAKKDDGYQMAITDVFGSGASPRQILGNILLYAGGFFIILIVSILLSRFVIKPAQIALEREKQFVSDASHELKTPLSAISINAQALENELGDNKHLHHILSESKRMEGLIKNLLQLSFLDEASHHMEKRVFNISNACEEIVLSMESSLFEKRILLNYSIDGGLYYTGDEASVKQLVAILLDNAMKHTPENGLVEVTLRSRGKKVLLSVENSGQGISEEDMPHIFERFYRVDKSRAGDSNSYGLGLAIAKSIVEAHDGRIKVKSESGKSVRFTAEL